MTRGHPYFDTDRIRIPRTWSRQLVFSWFAVVTSEVTLDRLDRLEKPTPVSFCFDVLVIWVPVTYFCFQCFMKERTVDFLSCNRRRGRWKDIT